MKVVIFGMGKVGMATDLTLKTNADFHDPAKGRVVANVNDYDMAIICVSSLEKGPHDHEALWQCMETLAAANFKGTIAIRCTVSPVHLMSITAVWRDLKIVHFPEFMKQGDGVYLDTPWILVLGGDKKVTVPFGMWLIDNGYGHEEQLHLCTVEESALIKLHQNAGLALKVTYANIMYEMCQQFGADYEVVRKGVAADVRVGPGHLQVPGEHGFGFNGHCLPKDMKCLNSLSPNHGFWSKILDVNEIMKVKNV